MKAIPVIAGLAVIIALLIGGPRPISLASEPTGDHRVVDLFLSHAERGHHRLSAVVVHGEEITYGGLGADQHTLYEIGSVTKTMTAQLLAELADAGTISPDTHIQEILPAAAGTDIADITLLELAEHTSGLPRLGAMNWPRLLVSGVTGANPYDASMADIVASALEMSPENRGSYVYSNFGFSLLGALLAMAAGGEYAELLQEHVLDSAGMENAYVMAPGNVPEKELRGLGSGGKPVAEWDDEGGAPAGGVRASAEDMGRYARFLFERGLPDYTWVEDERPGVYWHNGGTGGFSTMTIIDPQRQIFITVMNDSTQGTEDLASVLYAAVAEGALA